MYNPSLPTRQGPSTRLLLVALVALTLAVGTGCDTIDGLIASGAGESSTADKKGKTKKSKKKGDKKGKTDKGDADDVDCEADCPCKCECGDEKAAVPPNQEPYPIVFAGNVKVKEGPMADEVAATKINDQRYSMRECYAPALKKDPTLKGEMDVQFTVSGETGKVIAAVVRESTLNDKAIETCVTGKAKAWTFDKDETKRRKRESVVRFTVMMLGVSL